jgi:hypothetical protein
VEVVGAGQRVDQRQLGRSRVAEDVPDALRAQHVEDDVAAGAGHDPAR